MHRRTAGFLVAITTVTVAVGAGWAITESESVNTYYAAAVRSMAGSWHAFAYASFDATGYLSVDKMPGALWVQALSVRLFGYHRWALLLPQVLAVTATVPLLYDAVRQWHSRRAAVVAAAVFAATPVTLALARTTVPDTLLVLCLVGAGNAATRAVRSARWPAVVAVGGWLGLGFVVKGGQALVVVPALALTWFVAGPGRWGRRLAAAVVAGGTTLVLAVAWPLMVTLTPAADRPYVDGTVGNSIWEQIASYNGLGRLTVLGLGGASVAPVPVPFGGPPGALRLLSDPLGTQIGWLLPMALVAAVVGLVVTRHARRWSPRRAGYLLWGGWLGCYATALSVADGIHPYSAATLSPAIAALVGAGAVTVVTATRRGVSLGWLLPVTVAATGAWAALLASRTPDFLPWLPKALVVVTAVATMTAVCRVWRGSARWLPRVARAAVLVIALVAVLLGPAAWTATVPVTARDNPDMGLNPMAGPGPNAIVGRSGSPAASHKDRLLTYLTTHRQRERFLVAVAGAEPAAPLVAAGHPVLAMGGFTGAAPRPTVPELARLVDAGDLRFVLLPPHAAYPASQRDRASWVRTRCRPVPATEVDRDGLHDCARRPAER